MSEFKKTLQDGTPNGAPTPERAESREPRRPRAKTTAPPTSHLYEPPPATHDESERRRAPAPTRIDSLPTPAPRAGAALPADAPGWMVRARSMSIALEALIASGSAAPSGEAAIERAWSAWELDGMPDKYVARVATLVDRARTAIRDTEDSQLERAYNDCAQVLWASLPREIRDRQDQGDVLLVMRGLRDEADPWAAIIEATARILGWTSAARAHAAYALRMALDAERTS